MDMHDDNRLELIERYKKQLVESTNIENSPDEMAVIDNILFRFWQMGWLKEQEAVPVDNGKCPSCNWDFENGELDFSNINESRFYCPNCGRAVKWK